MSHFIFAYHGGNRPDTPEEGAKVMAQWEAWFKEMGDAVVNPGNPVGMSKTVSGSGVTDDGGANPLSGFTIVSAGGIGLQLQSSLNTLAWPQVTLILIVILAAVVIGEWVSAKVRGAII